MAISFHNSLSEIADSYDAYLIDLWGVMHDGLTPYPGAIECLEALQAHNKELIFVSNAPRRAQRAIDKLTEFGVPRDHYDHLVTSGEVTYHALRRNMHDFGKNYFMIGPERDHDLLDGLDYNMVSNPAEANFIICAGFDHDAQTMADIQPILDALIPHKLPMICANPDSVVVRRDGTRALCAGEIAREYEKMDGTSIFYGKPYGTIYDHAFSLLNNAQSIAMIGDNLHTDIAGALDAGIDSFLIAGGILGEELGIEHGQLPEKKALEALCKREKVAPTGVLPAFLY